MAKEPYRFRCPCCAKQLIFDPVSGEARREPSAGGAAKGGSESTGPDIRDLVAMQEREKRRLGDAFSRAAEDTISQAEKFDDIFKGAVEDAKKDKSTRPKRPFDLE